MRCRSSVAVLAAAGFSLGCSSSRAPQMRTAPVTDLGTAVALVGPDSLTSLGLFLLTRASTAIAESTSVLPSSMEQILQSTLGPVPANASWAKDGWGRPIVVSRSKNGKELLLLSLGADGVLGNGDDDFRVVRRD